MNVIDMVQAAIVKRRLAGQIPDNVYPLVKLGNETYWIADYQQGVVNLTQVKYNHNAKCWQWPYERNDFFMNADMIASAELVWLKVRE